MFYKEKVDSQAIAQLFPSLFLFLFDKACCSSHFLRERQKDCFCFEHDVSMKLQEEEEVEG